MWCQQETQLNMFDIHTSLSYATTRGEDTSMMRIAVSRSLIALSAYLLLCSFVAFAQKQSSSKKKLDSEALPTNVPVATKWTLDAAGELQRVAIKSVLLLGCPSTGMKGTGFISDGLVVTNNHVVNGCSAEQMVGISVFGTQVSFTKMVTDPIVDLALLWPSQLLTGGLSLAEADDIPVGASVSTWGYPLQFNGPAPLLATGVIAGYMQDGLGERKVKHLVINGAINPGNSGGPLFTSGDDKVIGVVVAKFLPYSAADSKIIEALSKNKYGMMYNGTDANGQPKSFSEAEIVAAVLQDFYNGTQVMIGEAIAVSELRSFLSQHEVELK